MAVAKESVAGQQRQLQQHQHHHQHHQHQHQSSEPHQASQGEQNCCASCQMPIKDRYIFSVIEQNFHQDCVRCSDCSGALNERCYAYEGKLYCRLDYWRRFGPKCSACLEPIKPTELVQRLKDNLVYHLSCFVCQDCKRHLQAGEQLHLIDDKRLLCKRDYLAAQAVEQRPASRQPAAGRQQQQQQQENLELLGPKEESELNDELGDELDDEASSSGGGPAELGELAGLDYGPAYGGGGGGGGQPANPRQGNSKQQQQREQAELQGLKGSDCGDELVDANGKRRGPRTTIKPKQLETLKRAFESAPKPSRHTREQLATETGLNMRVIQVWFQNRRSKERRMKNHNGVARSRFFRSTSRRLRVGPAGGAGTPTGAGAPPQSLIAGGRAGGKQQGAAKAQSHQQQMSPMEEPQLQQQGGGGGGQSGQGRQAPMSHNSPSDFGGSSSGGFTYFSDSSNQGDAFAINATGHQASQQQSAQQQQQYLSALKQEPIKQETSLMALEPPPVVGQSPNGGGQAPQQQQPQQQQQQYGQHQSMKNTPPPPMFQSGGQPPPPPPHMMGGPQQLGPHPMMVNSRMVMQPQPAGAMSGLGPPGLLGHPQGPSVVQW